MRYNFFCGKKARVFLFFHFLFLRSSPVKAHCQKSPKNILLSCWGALGDVVLATSVVSKILQRYPDAKIGFVCDSKASIVVQTLAPMVYIHSIPNWRTGRKGVVQSLLSWIYHTVLIYPKAIREIRKKSYDVSLELHLFFPTSVSLLYKANVPCRIGFCSGGYENMLTDFVCLPQTLCYLPQLYSYLLEKIGVPKDLDVAPIISSSQKREEVILHLGTSDPRKEWPSACWKLVAQELRKRGYSLVFTGQGEREKFLIQEAFSQELGTNLCNSLSFDAFAERIKQAKAIVSVDSVSVHLAAYFGVPFVALYLYNESLPLWVPTQATGRVLIGNSIAFSDVISQFLSLVETKNGGESIGG